MMHLRKLTTLLLLVLLCACLAGSLPDRPVSARADLQEEEPPEEEQETPGIIGTILHSIGISSTSLYDVWQAVLNRSAENFLSEIQGEFEAAADMQASLLGSYTGSGLDGVALTASTSGGDVQLSQSARDIWSRLFNLSVLFFPLVILLHVGSVLTSGVSAPIARAEMLEGLVRALLAIGFCAASFLIGSHLVRLGWGLAEALKPEDMSAAWIKAWIPMGVGAAAMGVGPFVSYGPTIFGIFLVFLVVIINLMLYGALILSHYAVIVITIALICGSPLVIVIGQFKPFAWIYWSWLKAFSAILLIPMANALLMRLWAASSLVDRDDGGMLNYFIALGFMCLLITLNFGIGKLVYQPMLEAGRKALESTRQLVGAVVKIAAAVGLAAAGAAAAVPAAGAASASGSGASAAGPAAGGGFPAIPGSGVNGEGGGASAAIAQNEGGNPYLNTSKEGRMQALQDNRSRQARVQTYGRASSSLLRSHPAVQAASQFFFGSQEGNLLAEKQAIQSAQAEMGDLMRGRAYRPAHAGQEERNASRERPEQPPGNAAEIWRGLWGLDGEKQGVYSERTPKHAAWRARAVNATGRQVARWQAEKPDLFEPLSRVQVSEAQFMASLAFRSAEDYFQPLLPNRSATVMYNRDALNTLERVAQAAPETQVGRIAAAARDYPPDAASSRESDPVNRFFNYLENNTERNQHAASQDIL